MSLESIQNSISSVQRDIESLQNRLTAKARDEASKTDRIAQINRSINKSTSASSIESKQRDMLRLQEEIARIQHDKADLAKRIAEKTALLHRHQADFYKEQGREQKKFTDALERERRDQGHLQQYLLDRFRIGLHEPRRDTGMSSGPKPESDYDAFISHASEYKDDLVRPLAEELVKRGRSIWYDEFKLTVGDSLRRSIDKGLARSKFGIVVLSPSFFAKNWPQYELDGLVAKEVSGGKVILPIWHKVSKNEVMQYSPSLADKLALSTVTYTIQELAGKLVDVINQR